MCAFNEINLRKLERRVNVLEQQNRIMRGVEDEYQRKRKQACAKERRENEAWAVEKERRLNAAQEKWLAAGWWTRKFTNSPRRKARVSANHAYSGLRDLINRLEWIEGGGLAQ